jgi:hypothetical protein
MRAIRRAVVATAKIASTRKWKPEKTHSLGDPFEYRGSVFDNPWLMIWPGLAIATLSALLSYGFDPDRASSK